MRSSQWPMLPNRSLLETKFEITSVISCKEVRVLFRTNKYAFGRRLACYFDPTRRSGPGQCNRERRTAGRKLASVGLTGVYYCITSGNLLRRREVLATHRNFADSLQHINTLGCQEVCDHIVNGTKIPICAAATRECIDGRKVIEHGDFCFE